MKLFEKEHPRDSVQVDVEVVKVSNEKVFQYTAMDDCTRMRVRRLYPRLNQHACLSFLRELVETFPFTISKIHCDLEFEFPLAFQLAVEATRHVTSLDQPTAFQPNLSLGSSYRIVR
jgi:transposase-like protein